MPLYLILIIVLISLLLIYFIISFVINIIASEYTDFRSDGYMSLVYPKIDEYKDLVYEPIEFMSSNNYTLRGFIYKNKDINDYKGIIIAVHGIGFGHNYLYNIIDFFTKNNYLVLAYDQIGSGISSGKGINNFISSIEDVNKAISFLKTSFQYSNLPIFLFGHSWGAFSSLNSLYKKCNNVEKGIFVAPFDCKNTMIIQYVPFLSIFKPGLTILDYFKCGKSALITSCKTLKKSKTDILLIHGDHDNIVIPKNSFDKYKKIKNNHINTILLKDRTHMCFTTKEAEVIQRSMQHEVSELTKTKTLYKLKRSTVKDQYELDKELCDKMINFYNS